MSLKKLVKKMNVLAKTDALERSVATSMLAVTADRIFTQGKAADGSTETYSKGYMKQRRKDGYPNSTKVIFQATRQMANDFSVISTGKNLGLGFKNSANADKSFWVEDTYDKAVFSHTKDEIETLNKLFTKELKKFLNG